MDFGLDFDGSCVTNDYPKIGQDIGAVPVLKKLIENNHRLILFTIRSNFNGKTDLDAAVEWFKNNDIPLYGINENPTQANWNSSPKIFADFYIDDLAVGCPLKLDRKLSLNPFIDWKIMEQWLINAQLIK